MSKPDVLIIGPYPRWDLDALEENFTLHKLWLASDRRAFLAAHGAKIKAIASRGELGANAELMAALTHLEIISSLGGRHRCN